MATFDDIARMRAALMAEKRQRMAQHPQQVAGAVGQAQGALAALAEQLQRQGIARDRITAANARAEADRKQRAAVEAAKAKAAAEKAWLDREARERAGQADLDWKRERFGEEQRIDPDAQRMRGFAVSERIAPPPPGDDDMPDGDDDLATPDERMRALLPDDRYDLERYRQAEEARGLDNSLTRERIRKEGALADKAAKTGAWLERKDRPAVPNTPDKAYGESAAPPGAAPPSLGGLRGVVPRAKLPKGQKVFDKELNKYSPEATADMIRKYDEAIALIESGGVDTGPFATPWEEFKDKKLGIGDPKTMKVIGLIEELRDAPSRDKSGAVIGVEEQESLGGIFGRKNIDEDTLVELLRQARVWLLKKDFGIRRTAATAGMVMNDAPYDPREAQGGAPKTKAGGSRIRVRNRASGKTGTILESDFNPSKYEKL